MPRLEIRRERRERRLEKERIAQERMANLAALKQQAQNASLIDPKLFDVSSLHQESTEKSLKSFATNRDEKKFMLDSSFIHDSFEIPSKFFTNNLIKRPVESVTNPENRLFESSNLLISAGKVISLPILVSAGSEINYSFQIEMYDIEFTVTFTPDEYHHNDSDGRGVEDDELLEGEEVISLVENQYISAEIGIVEGTLSNFDQNGIVNFHLDNEFSWMREKVIEYRIELQLQPHIDQKNFETDQLAVNKKRENARHICLELHDNILASQRNVNSLKHLATELSDVVQSKRNDIILLMQEINVLNEHGNTICNVYTTEVERLGSLEKARDAYGMTLYFTSLDAGVMARIFEFGSMDDLKGWQYVNKAWYNRMTRFLEEKAQNFENSTS